MKYTTDKKGFTLVELLVVISIIALLLSILLPSLNKARESGRRVVCGTHLHQWGLAIAAYSSENRNKLPRPYSFVYLWNLNYPDCSEGKISKDFGYHIYPYIKDASAALCPSNPTWKKADSTIPVLWAQLPVSQQNLVPGYAEPYQDGYYTTQYSFFMDSDYFDNSGDWDPRIIPDTLSDNGGLLLGMDLTLLSAYPTYWPRTLNHPSKGQIPDFKWRVQDAVKNISGANCLYLDGSVEWTRGGGLTYSVKPYGGSMIGNYLRPQPKCYK